MKIERILLTELNNDKVRIRRKVLDALVKTKNDRINIEINITEMAKLCYNGEKEMCLLGMLDMSQKELESIKGDKYMDRLKEEVVEINNDEEMIKLLSDEDEERLYINTMKEIGKEEGVKEGIEQNKLEMVKKMLKENIDISTISRVSGLSEKEIKEIAKEK